MREALISLIYGVIIYHGWLNMFCTGSIARAISLIGIWRWNWQPPGPYTRLADLPAQIKRSVTLWDTIIAWREVRKAYGLPFLLPKHMPLWGHPEYSQDNNYPLYNRPLKEKGI